MTSDPILQSLALAAAAKGEPGGEVVRLVADGVVWQGRLIGPAAWADVVASVPSEGDVFADLGEDSGADTPAFLHFATASFLAGGEWHRARGVRIAVRSVSAWWRHLNDEG
ncbi:hypothetical protein [Streptacidiphilus sp. EB129]|uniref:hypothetical protein n=1 Tax=Streptacidiphilus sp. EB129 TaxID=3156262 RepID=UPI003514EBBF